MPSALPHLNRRRLLLGTLPATVAVGLLVSTTACAPDVPPADLADLQTQFDRARADSELAGAAATALRGPQQQARIAALTAIAAERTAHADALGAEITRLTEGESPVTNSATPTTSAAPAPQPTVDDVIAALRESADTATQTAERLAGYRAGLLGSIAASCTASYQVALGGKANP